MKEVREAVLGMDRKRMYEKCKEKPELIAEVEESDLIAEVEGSFS